MINASDFLTKLDSFCARHFLHRPFLPRLLLNNAEKIVLRVSDCGDVDGFVDVGSWVEEKSDDGFPYFLRSDGGVWDVPAIEDGSFTFFEVET